MLEAQRVALVDMPRTLVGDFHADFLERQLLTDEKEGDHRQDGGDRQPDQQVPRPAALLLALRLGGVCSATFGRALPLLRGFGRLVLGRGRLIRLRLIRLTFARRWALLGLCHRLIQSSLQLLIWTRSSCQITAEDTIRDGRLRMSRLRAIFERVGAISRVAPSR